MPMQAQQHQVGPAPLLSLACLTITLNFSEGILKRNPARDFNAVVIQPASCLVFRNDCCEEGGD